MTEDEVKELEAAFDVRLPSGYRHLLLSPPSMLIALMDSLAEEHSDYEVPAFLKAEVIRNENSEARDPEEGFVYDVEDEDAVWPNEYFIIGGDCGGNRYFIKPTSGVSAVYEWDHSGAAEIELVSETIAQYVEHWFKELGEVAAMDCVPDDPAPSE